MAAAVVDVYPVPPDGLLHVDAPGVLGNDLDLQPEDVASLVSGPSYGRASLLAHGGLAYAPDYGFVGEDKLTYEVGGSQATVTFSVGGPIVQPDAYTVAVDTPLVVAAPGPLANDTGIGLTFEIVGNPSAGQIVGWHTGWFAWVPPDAVWSGVVTVDYRATDKFGRSADSTITITVGEEGVLHTFTIANEGTGNLILGEPPVTITGLNPSDFLVVKQPALVVTPQQSTTFDVRFDPQPGPSGLRKAVVTVCSNDEDEAEYDFAIQGEYVAITATDLVLEMAATDPLKMDLTPEVEIDMLAWFVTSRKF